MSVIEVTSDEQFTRLTTEVSPKTLIALYFHTPWADPCVQMNSVFSSLAGIYTDHRFLSINADDFPDISESFDVSAVPYFVILRDSTIVKELSGADPRELATTIQQITSTGSTKDSSGSTTAAGVAGGASGNSPEPPAPGTAAATTSADEEESKEELYQRLTKLVNAAPVMLFMKGNPGEPKCGFSRQLVAILREHQVRFGFFDILKDNSVREGLKEFSDWPTFPQLYIQGELQGGLDIVKEALEEDPDFFQNAIAAGSS